MTSLFLSEGHISGLLPSSAIIPYQCFSLKVLPPKWDWPSAKVSTLSSTACYLQVSVNDVQGVEVGHSLQDLTHHIAGVPLWVVALVQDPIKYLSACGAAERWESKAR